MINCLFCKKTVSFVKSVLICSDESLKTEMDVRICFDCIKWINQKVAEKYREHGWHITKDALVVNTEYNSEKETA